MKVYQTSVLCPICLDEIRLCSNQNIFYTYTCNSPHCGFNLCDPNRINPTVFNIYCGVDPNGTFRIDYYRLLVNSRNIIITVELRNNLNPGHKVFLGPDVIVDSPDIIDPCLILEVSEKYVRKYYNLKCFI